MTNATATARRPVELWAALGTIAIVSAVYLPVARAAPPAPSGLFGHALGIAGFLLMLFAETGYTWRKRVQREGRGPLRRWLQAHVFTGLVGPYLVLLHTSFRFQGLAGVAALLVGVVVASGLVGRFAFTAAPKHAPAPGEPPRTGPRRALSLWYLFHVPLAAAMFVLALVHVAAALYYATLLR
jgi:cytochrome b561